MNRATFLDRRFNDTLGGKTSPEANYSLFLEAIRTQQDPAACINKIVESPNGSRALQAAMRHNTSSSFLNGTATTTLLYFFQVPGLGDVLDYLLKAIVDPPIFWTAFYQAFDKGDLHDQAQEAFAMLLLRLMCLTIGNTSSYRTIAKKPSILAKLLSSSRQSIKDIGCRIQHILATFESGTLVAGVEGPGGCHDNDFLDFREISILPSADEIVCKQPPFLPQNSMLDGPATYLDSTFRLLRDEMIYEIREELQTALGMKKRHNCGLTIDSIKLVGVYSGTCDEKIRWGIMVQCQDDFKSMKDVPENKRRSYLEKDLAGSKILEHHSLVCILSGNHIVSFGSVYRDEELLAQKSPVVIIQLEGEANIKKTLLCLRSSDNTRLIQIDVALFTFRPVLRALQNMWLIPLLEELLFWKKGDIISSAAVIATQVTRALVMDPSLDLQVVLKTPTRVVLDKAQAASLLAGLTQRVSLIQGPPGTGKSFIGALLAKAIHDYTNQQILVVCHTDRAVGQFLEDLWKIGIPGTSMVRLDTTQVAPLSFASQRKERAMRSTADGIIIDQLKKSLDSYRNNLEEAMNQFIGSKIALNDILTYLEFEEPQYFEAFRIPEVDDSEITRADDGGKAIDPRDLIDKWSRGLDSGQLKDEPNVLAAMNIWTMPPDTRHELMENWESAIRKMILEEICTRGGNYNDCQDQLSRKLGEATAAAFVEKRIIVCTMTGAAKFAQDIRAAKPDVLLVEEANEILESHVLTAMGENTSQMILIGDHKQLRPKVNNYNLSVEKGDGFELNRSLFERLVLKGFPHQTLVTQHRMRPEISAFIRTLTYPDLTDAPETQGRANIRGVQSNFIFVDHRHHEDDDLHVSDQGDGGSSVSKRNTYEAEMIWKIVNYLVQQGHGTDKLVVLTPYLGQLAKLRDVLNNDNDPILNDLDSHDLIRAGLLPAVGNKAKRRIRLATIDNYQGEGSDIVIASLTRSNDKNEIGFMNSPERLNVLISRARDGFILIGNSETFINSRKGKEFWSKFFQLVKRGGYMYGGFPTKCERHPNRTVFIKSASEFDTHCPDGGCTEPCGAMMNCGIHTCPLICHQMSDHLQMRCEHSCSDMCAANLHTLEWKCHASRPRKCAVCKEESRLAKVKVKQERKLKKRQEEEERQLKKRQEKEKRQLKKRQEKEERQRQWELTHEQSEQDLRVAELLNKIKAVVDDIADASIGQQRTDDLEQKVRDLEAIKSSAQKAATIAQARADALFAASSSNTLGLASPSNPRSKLPPTNYTPSSLGTKASAKPSEKQTSTSNLETTKSGSSPTSVNSVAPTAHQEWLYLKQVEGEENDALDGIMALTGLEDVKTQILRIKARIDLMKRKEVPTNEECFNVVLLGNKGTGKRTVARLYVQFLQSIQVLPGNAFVESTGSSLAHKGVDGAKKLIMDAKAVGGGAIFVDEAYQLVSEHQQSGGQVLDFLLAEMENQVGTLVFILAGYSKQMEKFFERNPSLPNRVPYTFKFTDYTDAELLTMLEALVEKRYSGRMKVEDGIRGLYARIAIRRLARGRGREGFGNARALQNMFLKIAQRQAERLEKDRKMSRITDDFMITKEDLIGPNPSEVLLHCAAWEKLEKMIGLDSVKESLLNFFDLVNTNYHRELQEKEPLQMSLNRVFLGSPGTGKTTVAKLYGQILTELGLLSNGEVVVEFKNPVDFVGTNPGHFEKNTKAILCNTVGKVLIIGEAHILYSMNSGALNQCRKTVFDTILAEIQSAPDEDRCVLLSGCKEEMEEMFQNVNPGLADRFAIENAFTFDDFTELQLREILDCKLKDQNLGATDEAKQVASDLLNCAKSCSNFSNIREVENLLCLAQDRYRKRQKSTGRRSHVIFESEDFDPYWKREHDAADNLMKLFEDLIGCDDIMRKLGDYQKIVRVMKASGVDMRKQIPTNFVFKGPPGTGRTTIAKKFGQVYYDMGFLSSPDLFECSASDLVGEYIGDTKTKKLFEKALGKVFFVDEAYRLNQGNFARETISEVVCLMTNNRFANDMVIIFAGYEDEMNALLSVNPDLASHFSEEIILTNLPAAKCLQILDKELRKIQVILSELTDTSSSYYEMENIINQMSHLSNWSNARDIKSIAQKLIHHALNTVVKNPGSALSLTANEAIVILKDILDQRCRRLNIPPTNVPPTSGSLLMTSSVDSTPLPPPSQTGTSSTTGSSHQLKRSKSKSSSDRPSTPGGSEPPDKPPSQSGRSRKSRSKRSQPLLSVPLSTDNPTPISTPRHRSRKLESSQQGSPISNGSQSLPCVSGSHPGSSQGNLRKIEDAQVNRSPPQSTPRQPSSVSYCVKRDQGVPSVVWKQLQEDKAAVKEAERMDIEERKRLDAELNKVSQRQQVVKAEVKALAKKQARDQAEEEELNRQQVAARTREAEVNAERERAAAAFKQICDEQNEKKREEEEIQEKLRSLDICVQGYPWIRQPSALGYRCAGGSHFVCDLQLR